MKVNICQPVGFTELGGRTNNEDSVYPELLEVSSKQRLFLVCDGVGGQHKGEVASELACASIARFFEQNLVEVPDEKYILSALKYTAEQFAQKELEDPETHGMATTFTLLHFNEAGATIAHLGDSRIYQIREGAVIRVSEDHKLVNELVRDGHITADEALTHTQRNVITKVIAADRFDIPDVKIINDVQAGDYFFLCTDGVLEQIYDDLLIYHLHTTDDNTLSNAEKLENLRQECVGKTRDNFTAYLIQIESVTGELKPEYKVDLPILNAISETPVAMPIESLKGKIHYEEDSPTEFTRPAVRSIHSSEIYLAPEQPPLEELKPASKKPKELNLIQFAIGILIGIVAAGGGVWYWMNKNGKTDEKKIDIVEVLKSSKDTLSVKVDKTTTKPISSPPVNKQKMDSKEESSKEESIVTSKKYKFSIIKVNGKYYAKEKTNKKEIIYDELVNQVDNVAYMYSFPNSNKKSYLYLVKPDKRIENVDRVLSILAHEVTYEVSGKTRKVDPRDGKEISPSAKEMLEKEGEKKKVDPV